MNSGLLGDLEEDLSTEYWAGERGHDSHTRKLFWVRAFSVIPQEGKDVMNFCVKNNSTHSPYSSFWKQAIFYSNLAWVTVTWSMQQPAQMALFSISTLQAPTKGMQNWEFAYLSCLLPRNCGKTLWWHFLFCAWAGSFGFEAVDSLLASVWKAKYEQRKQGKNSAHAFYRLPSFLQHKKTQRTPQSLVIPLLL